MDKQGFIYAELGESSLIEGKAFDGMAPGDFVDRHGTPVKITESELGEFVTNTLAKLEAEKTESGEIAGLTIKADSHTSENAAGWIMGLEQVGNIIRFIPKWTELGVGLIKGGLQKFFSPTLDLTNRLIAGGSLTNDPASKDKRGHVLLKAVELSEGLYVPEYTTPTFGEDIKALLARLQGLINPSQEVGEGIEDNMKFKDLSKEERAELGAEALDKQLGGDTVELGGKLSELVEARVTKGVEVELAKVEREKGIAEFSAKVIGGAEENPVGLPIAADKLEAFLSKLDGELLEDAKELFEAIHTSGMVDFSEKGHKKGVQGKTQLPKAFADKLDSGELEIADLSKDMSGLGDLSDYDLSKWDKE